MHCLNCNRTEQEVPLLTLSYKERTYHICTQCLPTLIHKPYLLEGKLPDAEKMEGV